MRQRCSGEFPNNRRRGSIAIGIAVVMLIVLTVSMELLSRCAQNLALAGEKMHYFSERTQLESAEVFVQMKLEDFLGDAVRAAAEHWQLKFPEDERGQADAEQMKEKMKDFEHQLNLYLQKENIKLIENFIDENFGGLDYEISQYNYRPDWSKVRLKVEVRNLSGRYQRSRWVTEYTIDIAMPGEEAAKNLQESQIDALVEQYKKNIRQELRYGEE